jgi:hypothetical protein
MDHFYGNRVFRQRTEMDFRKIVNAFRESDRFGQDLQEGNRRLARRPPIDESSNVIVPS